MYLLIFEDYALLTKLDKLTDLKIPLEITDDGEVWFDGEKIDHGYIIKDKHPQNYYAYTKDEAKKDFLVYHAAKYLKRKGYKIYQTEGEL